MSISWEGDPIVLGHQHLGLFRHRNYFQTAIHADSSPPPPPPPLGLDRVKPEVASILRNYTQLSRIKPQVFRINPQVNHTKRTLNPGEIRKQPGIDLQADRKQSQPRAKGPPAITNPKPYYIRAVTCNCKEKATELRSMLA